MTKLAIAIPTYNRASILVENLARMLPALGQYGIAIYVSDDSPNEETARALAELSYPDLHYRQNTPGLGHDQNLMETLLWPEADYVWLLADALYPESELFENVVQAWATQPDAIFLNYDSWFEQNRSIQGQEDVKAFLYQQVWHMTMTGVAIYGLRLREFLREHRTRCSFKNFPQLALIMNLLRMPNPSLVWIGARYIHVNSSKQASYWAKSDTSILTTFGSDWVRLIDSFDDIYSDAEREIMIRSHSRYRGIFTVRYFLFCRAHGLFSLMFVREHMAMIKRVTSIPYSWVEWIARIPPVFLRGIIRLKRILVWR
ncbi:glycosyltransferase family 2 protein [Aquirhabdus parva]|uniref:Glycosyltransferase n=1 Tax=Aquirhabdus parva TaxID=2283318 RepID=A0A345PAF5_9GAMM|nr:glycosyltransferase family 2 protein [Aquirhabdus parva]AXI04264.1 glycosyltransferase [Aquirhabdus parva]